MTTNTCQSSHSVVVSTPDFESGVVGSNIGTHDVRTSENPSGSRFCPHQIKVVDNSLITHCHMMHVGIVSQYEEPTDRQTDRQTDK